MKSKYFQNRGIVSIYALLLMTLFLTMGLALLALQLASFQDTRNILDATQARFLAESALQEARYYLMNIDANFSGTSPEEVVAIGGINIGTYKYTITKSGANIYDVSATGYIPNSTAFKKLSDTLTLRIRNPNPYNFFSDGFESNNLNAWSGQANDSGTLWDLNTTAPNNGTYHARGRRTSGGGGTRIARLLTPSFNLSGYDAVVLRFSYRQGPTAGTRFRVYQNTTGSPTTGWVRVYNDTTDDWSAGYVRPAVRINVTPLTSTVQFRFEAHMQATNQAWFLDDVLLVTPYAVYDATLDPM